MPKVSKEYIEEKKRAILEDALKVCKGKPLYEITMTDIIKETGLSHGGIYRYFSNLDEILIEVINNVNANIDYIDDVDKLIKKNKSSSETITDLLTFLGIYIKDNVKTTGKFQFELTVLLANHPDRQQKILSQLIEEENSQYLMEQIFKTIDEGIKNGDFKPTLPVRDIYAYLITSIDGIVRDTVLQECYGLTADFTIDAPTYLKMVAESLLSMLIVMT